MWLVGFRYLFGKNYGWGLCAAKNMYKIIFDISVLKWSENIKKIINLK